ncbi:MAG TPA: type VI secretion system tube protein Hcp [Pyrinomonadaceae bacterium]
MDTIIMDMGGDVKGESTREGYRDKIELLTFSHGVAMQMTGDISTRERTSGRPNHQDMTVTKYLDRASPILNLRCCEGKMFPQVDIIIGLDNHGAVVELMRYTLKNVLISSISIGGGGGDRPVETLTLNYTQITWDFKDQKPGVAAKGSWDLSTNSAR